MKKYRKVIALLLALATVLDAVPVITSPVTVEAYCKRKQLFSAPKQEILCPSTGALYTGRNASRKTKRASLSRMDSGYTYRR